MPALPNNWLQSSIIYQVFVGRWQNANLIDHPGKVFTSLEHLDFSNLLDNGINCIYLLGVFDNTGPIIVDQEENVDLSKSNQRLPSVFAISDHQNTNPILGNISELKRLINHLQESGFRVILDFVPNHTSTVHPWTISHPDYYHKNGDQFVAEFSGDVYKLNYGNQELFAKMFEVLKFLASLGVDGVRVDMAHLVPKSFWDFAIRNIKINYPDLIFLAEAYPDSPFDLTPLHTLLESGFDAVYNGHLYHNLKSVLNGDQLDNLVSHINHTNEAFRASTLLNYISNHDDSQPESANQYIEALISLILFLPGIPFIYNGSLLGHSKRLAHHCYDQLSQEMLEINGLPNLSNIFKFREENNPVITKLTNDGSLLSGSLSTIKGKMTFFANFSMQPVNLDLQNTSLGLIHDIDSRGVLPSGTIEIFKD